MSYLGVKAVTFFIVLLTSYCLEISRANEQYRIEDDVFNTVGGVFNIEKLMESRHKRDVTTPTTPTVHPASNVVNATAQASDTLAAISTPPPHASTDHAAAEDANRSTNMTKATPMATVTKTPLLGFNGTGTRRYNSTNMPKVSDPILANENFSDVFKTPEKIKAEKNLGNLTYDNHIYYNSTFIANKTYFDEHWANITRPQANVHPILSDSHRRATISKLKFKFPFYGHMLTNITIATGGFIFTGDQVHTWLAATQYIAPLMANFDTTITNESLVKLYDDGEKFTTLWENVTLQEETDKNFTFAVTLYKNGDIVFAYKHIPIPVENITDKEHPVKVGISDAYLTHNYVFYVRQKTIYEYHRISFKNYEIASNTILKIVALPTCPLYESCEACMNHKTNFNCSWCGSLKKCSSGTDRNKQDWTLRRCDALQITDISQCNVTKTKSDNNTAYVTDGQKVVHDATIVNVTAVDVTDKETQPRKVLTPEPHESPAPETQPASMGGPVAAVTIVTLVFALAAWIMYAFKNPHTRSGQLLIKYRPSQWTWRRGEARYTAATIHM